MLGNNGRTKNDRYQKAALKGTKISTKHTYIRAELVTKSLLVCVRSSTKGFWTYGSVLYVVYRTKKKTVAT